MKVVEFFAQKNGGKTPIQLLDEGIRFTPMYVCWFAEEYHAEQLSKADVSNRRELYFAFMKEYNALMGKGEHQILKEEVEVLLAKYSC